MASKKTAKKVNDAPSFYELKAGEKMKPGYKRCFCGVAVRGPQTKVCPKCGQAFPAKMDKPTKEVKPTGQTESPKIALLKVLKGRGFEVRGSQDIFDPKAEIKIETGKDIAPILEYVDAYQTNGKFELSLDALLTLLKLPLSK